MAIGDAKKDKCNQPTTCMHMYVDYYYELDKNDVTCHTQRWH